MASRLYAWILLLIVASGFEFASDWLFRVHDHDGVNGIDAHSWDVYMSLTMCLALAGIVMEGVIAIRRERERDVPPT